MEKVVLITGGARGIGQSLSQAFAKEGYFVACNYSHSLEKAIELKNTYSNINIYKADISDRDQVNQMIKKVIKDFGKIDILINNAGISDIGLFTEIKEADWDKLFAVNIKGTFNCCQEVLKDMIKRKSGSIINIASMWGEIGASCEVAYSTTKAGIIGFTKALAKELGPSNIRVNAISPGLIESQINQGLDTSEICDQTPLCRIGQPEDVANCALFLASEKASFITGQVIGVNGGLVT